MKKLINYIVFMGEIGGIKWILRIGMNLIKFMKRHLN